ncbi:MAG: acyl carrier protein [Geobacteraceae bacterium]|nr:acyl carrier protein [Geobacteraceae bacterium]
MTRKEFIAEIENLVEVEAGTLTGESELGDIKQWDSLAVVAFIALVDENFGFTPSPKDIADSKTVEDLVRIVGSGIEG